jgi:hypothetical protein
MSLDMADSKEYSSNRHYNYTGRPTHSAAGLRRDLISA